MIACIELLKVIKNYLNYIDYGRVKRPPEKGEYSALQENVGPFL